MNVVAKSPANPSTEPCFLGMDVGGTQTRWALATATGELIAEGVAEGFSATRLASEDETEIVHGRLNNIAQTVRRSEKNCRLSGKNTDNLLKLFTCWSASAWAKSVL